MQAFLEMKTLAMFSFSLALWDPSFMQQVCNNRERSELIICHLHIFYNTPSFPPPRPNFCVTFVFNFFWVLQSPHEKLKTVLWEGGRRANKVHYGRCASGEWNVFPPVLPLVQPAKWSTTASFGNFSLWCNDQLPSRQDFPEPVNVVMNIVFTWHRNNEKNICDDNLGDNSGADPGFFLGGGALISCCTSTLINHIVFFFFGRIPVVLENRRSSQGVGGAHPLHPPPRSAPATNMTRNTHKRQKKLVIQI